MPKYTQGRFAKDLKQLGGMIENFYSSQSGGNCPLQDGGKKKRAAKKRSASVKRKTKQGGAPKDLRHFTLVMVGNNRRKNTGVYNGRTPLTAAGKAFKQICEKKNKNQCRSTFTIRETTQGSKKKEYKYTGSFEKLSKPKPIQYGKMKKKYFQTHKRVVKRVR